MRSLRVCRVHALGLHRERMLHPSLYRLENATNNATAISDVDLLVSNEIKGLKYVGIYEELTNNMHKKIDLIRIDDLIMNFDFLNEVLRNGIKIYERREK